MSQFGRYSWCQRTFKSGELTHFMSRRSDLEIYDTSVKQLVNFFPIPQGPVLKRQGTRFIANSLDQNNKPFLMKFVFNSNDSYMLCFTNLQMVAYKTEGAVDTSSSGFYQNTGSLTNTTPYYLTTPYQSQHIENLRYVQSGDIVYIVHPYYPLKQLVRLRDNNGYVKWSLIDVDLNDGPYLSLNTTNTTIIASGTAPNYTITSSANLFDSNRDIGRLIRILNGSNWSWGKITAVSSSTVATYNLVSTTAPPTTATTNWRLGVYYGDRTYPNNSNNFPSEIEFHQNRLVLAAPPSNPEQIDISSSNSYISFKPTNDNGQVLAENALSLPVNSSLVNSIAWVRSDEKALLVGTYGSESIIRGEQSGSILTPTSSQQARVVSSLGSSRITPVRMGKGIIYSGRGNNVIQEMLYDFQVDGFQAKNINYQGEHITKKKIVKMCTVTNPYSQVWFCLEDGTLGCMSYDKENQILGYSRHVLGAGDYINSNGDKIKNEVFVDFIESKPSSDGSHDEVWMAVKRTINGNTYRTIEKMGAPASQFSTYENEFFLDCWQISTNAVNGKINGQTIILPQLNYSGKFPNNYSFSNPVKNSNTEYSCVINGMVDQKLYANKASNSVDTTFDGNGSSSVNDISAYVGFQYESLLETHLPEIRNGPPGMLFYQGNDMQHIYVDLINSTETCIVNGREMRSVKNTQKYDKEPERSTKMVIVTAATPMAVGQNIGTTIYIEHKEPLNCIIRSVACNFMSNPK